MFLFILVFLVLDPVLSNRRCQFSADCHEDQKEDYQSFSVMC